MKDHDQVDMSKELPGATGEEILTVPVAVTDVPCGAMVWDGARIIRVQRIARIGTTVTLHSECGTSWSLPASPDVMVRVVCGATSERLVGRLAFYGGG